MTVPHTTVVAARKRARAIRCSVWFSAKGASAMRCEQTHKQTHEPPINLSGTGAIVMSAPALFSLRTPVAHPPPPTHTHTPFWGVRRRTGRRPFRATRCSSAARASSTRRCSRARVCRRYTALSAVCGTPVVCLRSVRCRRLHVAGCGEEGAVACGASNVACCMFVMFHVACGASNVILGRS